MGLIWQWLRCIVGGLGALFVALRGLVRRVTIASFRADGHFVLWELSLIGRISKDYALGKRHDRFERKNARFAFGFARDLGAARRTSRNARH